MKISPTGHRVLIKLDPVEETSKSGIILSTDKETKRQQAGAQFGEVIAIGPLAWLDMGEGDPWAAVGDHVITVRYAGAQFNYNDDELERYRIINDDEIIGRVRGEHE